MWQPLRFWWRTHGHFLVGPMAASALAVFFFISNIQLILFKLEPAKSILSSKDVISAHSRVQTVNTFDQQGMLATNLRLGSGISDSRRLTDKQSPSIRLSSNDPATNEVDTPTTDSKDSEFGDEEKAEIGITQAPPRTMSSTENPIYYMHIGKSGKMVTCIVVLHILFRMNVCTSAACLLLPPCYPSPQEEHL